MRQITFENVTDFERADFFLEFMWSYGCHKT